MKKFGLIFLTLLLSISLMACSFEKDDTIIEDFDDEEEEIEEIEDEDEEEKEEKKKDNRHEEEKEDDEPTEEVDDYYFTSEEREALREHFDDDEYKQLVKEYNKLIDAFSLLDLTDEEAAKELANDLENFNKKYNLSEIFEEAGINQEMDIEDEKDEENDDDSIFGYKTMAEFYKDQKSSFDLEVDKVNREHPGTLNAKVYVDGNLLVYEYTFLTVPKSSALVEAAEETCNNLESNMTDVATAIGLVVAEEGIGVKLIYKDMNGEILTSRIFR